jgi:FkbM family methyltransferase
MNTFTEVAKTYIKRILGRGVFTSYAQNGEDALVYALLRSVVHGTYVDVGAYHPVLYSNTYAFYKRGWHGVVIDPNESMQPLYKALRPRDTFVHAGVARTKGTQTYFAFSDGAYNTFDPKEAAERKAAAYPHFKEELQVALRPLADILHEQGITHVDFLTIDIEGMDIEALESYDWSMSPKVIAIESHGFNPDRPTDEPVYAFLKAKGYRLEGMAAYTLVFGRAK